jgi:diguanylate cyclase
MPQHWQEGLNRRIGTYVPAPIRSRIPVLQVEQLRRHVPILYLAVALITAAGAIALAGDYPLLEQLILPTVLVVVSAVRGVSWWRNRDKLLSLELARRYLRHNFAAAIALSLIGGFWTVAVYFETAEAWRVHTPLFTLMASFAAANCLAIFPRAAIGSVVCGLGPIAAVMLVSGNFAEQSIACTILAVAMLQCWMVTRNFAETVKAELLQSETTRLALTDPLTGLDNRRAFRAIVDAAALRSNARFSIFMIDLDNFKPVNDRFGHAAGDHVLAQVAQRLCQLCPGAPSISRLGGDEFAVLLDWVVDLRAVAGIKEALRLPYEIDGNPQSVGVSLGWANFPEHGAQPSQVLHAADESLYADKFANKSKQAA